MKLLAVFLGKYRKILLTTAVLVTLLIGAWAVSQIEPESNPRLERYFVTSKSFPRFTEATFAPFDFKPGEKQTVTVYLNNPNPIESVTAVIKTDNLVNTYELKLSEGEVTAGIWKGSWQIKDTHNYIYRATFLAESGSDKSSIDLTFK